MSICANKLLACLARKTWFVAYVFILVSTFLTTYLTKTIVILQDFTDNVPSVLDEKNRRLKYTLCKKLWKNCLKTQQLGHSCVFKRRIRLWILSLPSEETNYLWFTNPNASQATRKHQHERNGAVGEGRGIKTKSTVNRPRCDHSQKNHLTV